MRSPLLFLLGMIDLLAGLCILFHKPFLFTFSVMLFKSIWTIVTAGFDFFTISLGVIDLATSIAILVMLLGVKAPILISIIGMISVVKGVYSIVFSL